MYTVSPITLAQLVHGSEFATALRNCGDTDFAEHIAIASLSREFLREKLAVNKDARIEAERRRKNEQPR
jgi:hypothetical protein